MEDRLIPSLFWDALYDQMPKYVQEVKDRLDEQPDCIGIGYSEDIGWFVLGSGQGPHLIWQEKENK